MDEYEPKTEASKKWEGWGTNLKPSYEPIVVARAPLDGTVVQNVLKHGCGAINIDATRIGSESITINRFDDGAKPFGGGAGHPYTSSQSRGRWPANTVLSHHPNCVQRGTKKVKTGIAYEPQPKKMERSIYGSTNTLGRERGYASLDGTETVESWECVKGCPVKMLDEQSGNVRSAGLYPTNYSHTGGYTGNDIGQGIQGPLYNDAGGASRFFYCAKASRAEREAGLHGRDQSDEDARRRMNKHSTVKPLELMRWLVRLVTPPNGTILDPFGGSGTTGVAARMEGVDAVVIDREWDWVDVAKKRVAQAAIDKGEATIEEAEEVGGDVQLGLFSKD